MFHNRIVAAMAIRSVTAADCGLGEGAQGLGNKEESSAPAAPKPRPTAPL